MANKEQDKATDWRIRLDAVEHFQGEPDLDRTALWNKLEQRLQGKHRTKKAAWYWAAAACAGLIIFISIMTSTRTSHAHKESLPAIHSVAAGTPSVGDHLEMGSPVIVSGRKKITRIKVEKKLSAAKMNRIAEIKPDALTYKKPVTLAHTPIEMAIDSTAKPVATILVHKKLAVVHINELEDADNTDERMAGEQKTKDQKIRIKNGRKWTRRAMAQSGPSSGYFKIEISLNN